MTLLWSLEETAKQLGDVSVRTVRRLIERRQLEAVKIGRRCLVVPASVTASESWWNSNSNPGIIRDARAMCREVTAHAKKERPRWSS